MSVIQEESELALSSEALAALREFAAEKGIEVSDPENLRKDVQNAFDWQDKEEIFQYEFSIEQQPVTLSLKGLRKDLGQTLESTGLTLWRAADLLAQFICHKPELFRSKRVIELGAGLGLCGLLVGRLCREVVITDGDDQTMELLEENIKRNDAPPNVEAHKLLWGSEVSPLLTKPGRENGFDVVMGADIIYEQEQISPLLATVKALLAPCGIFYLAFSRRNVPFEEVLLQSMKLGFQCAGPLSIGEQENNSSVDGVYAFTFSSSASQ